MPSSPIGFIGPPASSSRRTCRGQISHTSPGRRQLGLFINVLASTTLAGHIPGRKQVRSAPPRTASPRPEFSLAPHQQHAQRSKSVAWKVLRRGNVPSASSSQSPRERQESRQLLFSLGYTTSIRAHTATVGIRAANAPLWRRYDSRRIRSQSTTARRQVRASISAIPDHTEKDAAFPPPQCRPPQQLTAPDPSTGGGS